MRRGGKEEDEVEQLLQAAQDEMILKLSVDSHTSRSSSDYLDPDLHSRFLALKSQKKKDQQQQQKQRPRMQPKSKDVVEETPEDLMLRFAALKTSLPSASSSSSVLLQDEIGEDSDEIGEDAEVEKLIQWAIDAARLDPSPSSDDEQSQNCDSDDENDSTRDVKP
ncbi:hypothetical protein AtNW77_Chr4g0301531 [Arabidopsis thaliana]|uniref:Uncharacterized protein n=3 Tax=Arabidopsis TaxID=3701 RepID=A0A178V7Y7_ARATH|nr:hypothetical protein ISN45_At04g025630 [Arabidopsis thaliana x Arabidopsis arenosa]KAG7621624.1 hypothetical protein ISN44_As04g025120 [Arabidopsis suecica]OAP01092.1 hypothetical protein AXX17_AT4G28230 [Arabidopsis thaliana]